MTEGKHCSVCNEVLVAQETVAALGHTEAIDAAVAATCTTTGLTEGKHCSVCNEVLVAQEEVAALGHTEVVDAAVEPTCTATGLTEGKHCSVCNEVLVAQEEVAALGHTEVVDAAVEPTCTATGLTEGKHCSVCNEVLVAQEEVAALGHKWDNDCDSTCNVCEEKRTVPDHVYGDWVVVEKPNASSTGKQERTCTVCGYKETEELPMTVSVGAWIAIIAVSILILGAAGFAVYWFIIRKKAPVAPVAPDAAGEVPMSDDAQVTDDSQATEETQETEEPQTPDEP